MWGSLSEEKTGEVEVGSELCLERIDDRGPARVDKKVASINWRVLLYSLRILA